MNTESSPIRSGPLSEAVKRRLARAFGAYGKKRVLDATKIAEATFWRAMAGGDLYYSTGLAIETGLDALEREMP
jgi:hypothetical protein